MKKLQTRRIIALSHLAVAAVIALDFACSDGSSDENLPGFVPVVQGPDAGIDSSPPPTDPDTGIVAPDAGTVALPPGCFTGTPTTYEQFLNACTDADYVIFDNCARLGLCNGAPLPALEVPVVDAGTD